MVGGSMGQTLALTAGELCGASADGAWVACRTMLPEVGLRCAVVARMRDTVADHAVSFTMGDATASATLRERYLPGIGAVLYAIADFPTATMGQRFAVAVAGIENRSA